VRQEYVQRIRALKGLEGEAPSGLATIGATKALRREALDIQRDQLLKLREEEVIGDDVLHRIQYELDLEEVGLG
jgi:hypothetical protein